MLEVLGTAAAIGVLYGVVMVASRHSRQEPRAMESGDAGNATRHGSAAVGDMDINALRKLAENGDAEAQKFLGQRYTDGVGAERNPVEGLKWTRQAAEQGEVFAQMNLGGMYLAGVGVERDPVEAAKWLRKAAEQGSATAQSLLGDCYKRGDGVANDPVEAARLYREAAERGWAGAQLSLAFCYRGGEGVEQSMTEAVKWFRKAAEQGVANAQMYLGLYCAMGRGVSQDRFEGLVWLILAAESERDAVEFRDQLVQTLGPQLTAKAQERSKRLRREIEPRKTAFFARESTKLTAPAKAFSPTSTFYAISR